MISRNLPIFLYFPFLPVFGSFLSTMQIATEGEENQKREEQKDYFSA